VTFLSFAPPEPSVVVPFLQLVALTEGHIFPQSDVAALYDQTRAAPLPLWYGGSKELPAAPRAVDEAEEGGGDVRRALMRLQVECAWRVGGGDVSEGETEWSEGRIVGGGSDDMVEFEEKGAGDKSMEVETKAGANVDALERMAAGADGRSFADAFVARRQHVALLVSQTFIRSTGEVGPS